MALRLQKIQVPEQSWSLLEIVEKAWPSSWQELKKRAKEDEEFNDLDETLDLLEKKDGPYFPLKRNIFRAFLLTPLHTVRVVIVGQDPYPQLNPFTGQPRAQGLCFSVDFSDEITSSLDTIYAELQREYPDDFVMPKHGNLESWAKQGVLMLNSSLTIKPGVPGSHGQIWFGFLSIVFDMLAEQRPNCIYLLVGQQARHPRLMKRIGGRATILEAPHPSGRNISKNSFLGGDWFIKVNKALVAQGSTPINWQPLLTEKQ